LGAARRRFPRPTSRASKDLRGKGWRDRRLQRSEGQGRHAHAEPYDNLPHELLNLVAQGPLVVEVPAGLTAGGVIDVWQRPITDIGQTGPDKGQGGKYLILPPGDDDVKTDGYYIKHSPSVQVWFATRGLSPDTKAAEETLRQHRLYSWN